MLHVPSASWDKKIAVAKSRVTRKLCRSSHKLVHNSCAVSASFAHPVAMAPPSAISACLLAAVLVGTALAKPVQPMFGGEMDVQARGAAGISPSTRAALWPLPVSVSYGTTTVQLPASSSDFSFTSSVSSATLTAAFDRYQAILYPSSGPVGSPIPRPAARHADASSTLTGIKVFVTSPSTPLDFNVNETYTYGWRCNAHSLARCVLTAASPLLAVNRLVVSAPVAQLYADTVWGAMHGLETFSQLVQVGTDAAGTDVLQVWDTPVDIFDAPRFPHRGLLIDTSRHYLPVDLIKHAIDGLSYNKCVCRLRCGLRPKAPLT